MTSAQPHGHTSIYTSTTPLFHAHAGEGILVSPVSGVPTRSVGMADGELFIIIIIIRKRPSASVFARSSRVILFDLSFLQRDAMVVVVFL